MYLVTQQQVYDIFLNNRFSKAMIVQQSAALKDCRNQIEVKPFLKDDSDPGSSYATACKGKSKAMSNAKAR